jgi:hypothetical protein
MVAMRNAVVLLAIAVLILSACAPQAAPTAAMSPAPSETPAPSATPAPTETPTVTPTATPTPIPSLTPNLVFTPTPDLRLPPERWQEWPVVPESFSPRLLEIYARGQELGNNPQAYSKIGDCESTPAWFLGPFDGKPEEYSLGEYTYLQAMIDYFHGSHGRLSLASGRGYTAANALSPLWADRAYCASSETPLACEIRLHRPAYALVMLGTNDIYHQESFDANMRQILDILIENGVIPILATKADNLEGDHAINLEIARLAYEYEIPLWNFWLAVQPLPSHGLQDDGSHLTWAGPFFDDPVRMKAAWPWRNLTALQSLDATWRAVAPPP